MEDGYTAQGAGFPFTEVAFECGMEGVEEGTHERDFETWARDTFAVDLVFD